ncbi:MAG TPA: acyl-CoA dehydrogenase family protein [Actinomycetota bacterium]|nr:acyl-CoA dehydrogenase family protein [Actinomycetota bacterium]
MDFAFSEEQNMLRDQARSFLADRVGPDRVADLAAADQGWDPEIYRQMAELGWIGLAAPEEAGGAGMSFIDEAVLFEELGRALFPGPFFSTVALATPLLERSGVSLDAVVAGQRSATLAWAEPSGPAHLADAASVTTKAEASNGSWTLSGEKYLIPDGGIVDDVLVVAAASDGIGVWSVSRSEAAATEHSTMDRTRRLGSLRLSATRGEPVVVAGEAEPLLRAVRLRALAAVALEAVGIGQRALELSIDYVKERKQFGKPIGAYQAVSHQVADIYAEVELARSLSYWAAWCVAEDDEQAGSAVSAAKSSAGAAAVAACERAIQVHGGIGFTWEHPLHLFYKRAQWINTFEGPGTVHRAELAERLLG